MGEDREPSPCLLEAVMPFVVRPYHRFSVQCPVTYDTGPFRGQGTIWNMSSSGFCISGDLPMRLGEILSLTVTLPNKQRIEIPEAVVRWSRGEEFAVEMTPHSSLPFQHHVVWLAIQPRL